jgi:hypothetical protein
MSADRYRPEAVAQRHLTDQHLKDLGVSLGHRLKMLHAISELESASVVANRPSAGTKSVSRDIAERRQLTAMFCDLVGSTERTFEGSSAPIIAAALASSSAMADLSPSTWATACSRISAIRKLTSMMQSAPYVRVSILSSWLNSSAWCAARCSAPRNRRKLYWLARIGPRSCCDWLDRSQSWLARSNASPAAGAAIPFVANRADPRWRNGPCVGA